METLIGVHRDSGTGTAVTKTAVRCGEKRQKVLTGVQSDYYDISVSVTAVHAD